MSPDMIGKLLALGCALFWAFAVILFKRSGETISPVALNLYKSTVASILLLPVWYFFDKKMIPESVSLTDLGLLAVSGVIGIAVADSLVFLCLNKLGAGFFSIIECSYSPGMIFLSWIILSETMTRNHIIGSLLVFCGVLIAASNHKKMPQISKKQMLTGTIAGISGILLMVASIIFVKPLLDSNSALLIIECRMIPAMISLHIWTLFQKKRKEIYKSLIRKNTFWIAFSGTILGNVIAMIAWVTAFKYTNLGSASVLNQTNVIFVIILASVFLNEPLDKRKILATALGFGGSIIVLCA